VFPSKHFAIDHFVYEFIRRNKQSHILRQRRPHELRDSDLLEVKFSDNDRRIAWYSGTKAGTAGTLGRVGQRLDCIGLDWVSKNGPICNSMAQIPLGSTRLDSTRLDTFDVSSPCILAVSS